MSNLARIPVGLRVRVGVRHSGGLETKDVFVAATWLDRFGQRWYAGTINGVAVVKPAAWFERLLGIKNESAPAFASAHS